MKQNTLFIIIASIVLIAGLVVAGCTQSSDTGASKSTGTAASGGGSAANNQQNAGPGQEPVSGGQSRGQGQGGFMNETRISETAAKLGVSADTLKEALDSTTNSTSGRPDMNAAAQKLGITQQQLADAFGFNEAGGGAFNGTRLQGKGNWTGQQGPDGQRPGQGQAR